MTAVTVLNFVLAGCIIRLLISNPNHHLDGTVPVVFDVGMVDKHLLVFAVKMYALALRAIAFPQREAVISPTRNFNVLYFVQCRNDINVT